MDIGHSLLLLLVLGDFLWSNDGRQLIYLVRVLRLFVTQVLIESCHGVLLQLLRMTRLR